MGIFDCNAFVIVHVTIVNMVSNFDLTVSQKEKGFFEIFENIKVLVLVRSDGQENKENHKTCCKGEKRT